MLGDVTSDVVAVSGTCPWRVGGGRQGCVLCLHTLTAKDGNLLRITRTAFIGCGLTFIDSLLGRRPGAKAHKRIVV